MNIYYRVGAGNFSLSDKVQFLTDGKALGVTIGGRYYYIYKEGVDIMRFSDDIEEGDLVSMEELGGYVGMDLYCAVNKPDNIEIPHFNVLGNATGMNTGNMNSGNFKELI